MTKKSANLYLVELYTKFIDDTKKGRRLQKNGKLVSSSTLKNYYALGDALKSFELITNEKILINAKYKYSKRAFETERRKYKKFYKKFTDYLYNKEEKAVIDNYETPVAKYLNEPTRNNHRIIGFVKVLDPTDHINKK